MNPYETLSDLKALPVPKPHCRARYEGSIDKTGKNADWDWNLYQDEKGEWVLFEHLGPGCIYNFVQHRYPSCEEPVFSFYFDGEETPRFTIRHSQFGEKYPFVEPLASRYIGPYDNGRGPIRVVRSFVPMPYKKSCRITSRIRLAGCDRTNNEGGWGHVIYHEYESAIGCETFSAEENPQIQKIIDLWKQAGSPVHNLQTPQKACRHGLTLAPGERITLLEDSGAGAVAGIRFMTEHYQPEHLSALAVHAFWDSHERPDIEASFGCLFSNELGYHSVNYLLSGMNTGGSYYNYYPMPYSESCRIILENRGNSPVTFPFCEIQWTREWNDYYRENGFYYFRSSSYYKRRHTEGADSIIARVKGSGHIIGSVITAFGETPQSRADCEGDVRIHIDGLRTPGIESDGSESYSCYGWGFETPQEYNPASGYDGHEHKDWSMHRSLPGDWYPFSSGFRFGIESGGCNDVYMEHSGMVFYYGSDVVRQKKIGEICFEDFFARLSSAKALPRTPNVFSDCRSGTLPHAYTCPDSLDLIQMTSFFEGDDDHIPVTLWGRRSRAWRSFALEIPSGAAAIVLRRVSDQTEGRQMADVFVDDVKIEEYPWYVPDFNPHKKWLEDEFVIPHKYFSQKPQIIVRIVPKPGDGRNPSAVTWNEFGYQFFARYE